MAAELMNTEAEKDLLSILLNAPEVVIDQNEKLFDGLFFDPFCRKIAAKIKQLVMDSAPVTISSITNSRNEQEYIRDIKVRSISPEFFGHFHELLQEAFIARELMGMSKSVESSLSGDAKNPSSLLATVRQKVEYLDENRSTSIFTAADIVGGIVDQYELLRKEVSEHDESYVRKGIVKTPYSGLNGILRKGGMVGEFYILAALPSTGKTEMALNLAAHAAIDQQKNVLFYSLEMDKESLVERILLERSGVDSHRLARGNINDAEMRKIITAAKLIENSGLIFEDNLSGDLYDIIASVRKANNRFKLDAVYIDYIQLISAPGANDNVRVSTITRALKQECVKLSIPFVGLSQLSRQHLVEKREPELHDLRDSGSLEQDADFVLFLHAAASERKKKDIAKTKALVKKQRSGPVGEFYLENHKTIQTFVEISRERFGVDKADKSREKEELDIIAGLDSPF